MPGTSGGAVGDATLDVGLMTGSENKPSLWYQHNSTSFNYRLYEDEKGVRLIIMSQRLINIDCDSF